MARRFNGGDVDDDDSGGCILIQLFTFLQLCFPKGLSFTTKPPPVPSGHTFIITREDGTTSHGTVLVFREKVESQEICSAMQVLQDMHMAELSNSQSLTLKRQKQNLQELNSAEGSDASADEADGRRKPSKQPVYEQGRDVLYCSKCICLLSRLPLVDAYSKILASLHDLVDLEIPTDAPPARSSSTGQPILPVASYVFNLLYEVEHLPVGRSLKIHTYKGPVLCQRPGERQRLVRLVD